MADSECREYDCFEGPLRSVPTSPQVARVGDIGHGEAIVSAGQIIQWQDLCAIVDDGSLPMQRYDAIEAAMRQQASLFSGGIAFLVILPPGARPPPDAIQRSVRDRLARLGSALSCLAYLVEGTGFKAVAARASLVSMKIFAPRPYPIYVETSMYDVLVKVLPHLQKGRSLTSDPSMIMSVIADSRLQLPTPQPAVRAMTDTTSK